MVLLFNEVYLIFDPVEKFSSNLHNKFDLVPPLSVQILRMDQSLVVGVARTVECEVRGARPNHKISWWKNGKQIAHAQTQVIVFIYSKSKSN